LGSSSLPDPRFQNKRSEGKKGRTMNPRTQSKKTTILPLPIALIVAWFGLSPQARALCQEGCLTNENTALGDDELLNTTGRFNTSIGVEALSQNTTGDANTPLVIVRFLSTQPATTTRPTVRMRCAKTQPAGSRRPGEGLHRPLRCSERDVAQRIP